MKHYTKILLCFFISGVFLSLLYTQVYAQETAEKDEETTEMNLKTDKVQESTVHLSGFGLGGTGFFVAPDKIATSFHVAAYLTTGPIFAKLGDKETTWTVEGVVAFDITKGLVILKIEDVGIPLSLGNSDTLKIGETIFVAGYSESQAKFKVVMETVENILCIDKWIRTTDQINMDNSGGPVLNSKGEVIGIHVGRLYDITPSDALELLLASVKETEAWEHWSKRKVVRAYVYNDQGKQKYYGGNSKEAIGDFNKAIKLNPNNVETYMLRARSKRNLGDHEGAIDDYNQILRLSPDNAETYIERGDVKRELGVDDSAIKDYSQAIKLKPDYIKAYERRGWAKQTVGDYIGVIEDFTHVIKLKPDDHDAYSTRGWAKRSLNDYAGAIDDFTRAIKLRPGDMIAYNDRGLAKYLHGDYAGAIEDHNDAIHLSSAIDYYDGVNPHELAAYIYRGRAKVKLGELAGAIEDFTYTIKLKPEQTSAYNDRGKVKVALKDYAGAIKDYDKAIELNPKFAKAYHNRGKAKEALGQHEAAKVDFEKAKELDPEVEK